MMAAAAGMTMESCLVQMTTKHRCTRTHTWVRPPRGSRRTCTTFQGICCRKRWISRLEELCKCLYPCYSPATAARRAGHSIERWSARPKACSAPHVKPAERKSPTRSTGSNKY